MHARLLGRLLHAARSRTRSTYAGTDLVDADTDGDGVRDGADDQDHDDIPNIMELQPQRLPRPGPWHRRPVRRGPALRTRLPRTAA